MCSVGERERVRGECREQTGGQSWAMVTLKMGSNVLQCHIMYVFSSPCVYVYMCIRSGSLETGGSWLAGCRRAMFGRLPARLAEGRWCYRVVAKCGSWAGRQRERERESGEDCLLTGVLLTCYLALHSHTQPHCSSTWFLFTALLECNQLKVSQVLTLFITSAIEMAAEKRG